MYGNTTFTYGNYSSHALLSIPSRYASWFSYFIMGKAPLINNHPNIELLHHSEALVDVPINHSMKWCDWCEYPPSYDNCSYSNYRPCFTKAVTMPRPWENIDPCILFSMTTITQKSAAKQHLTIRASLNKTIQLLSKYSSVDKLLLL